MPRRLSVVASRFRAALRREAASLRQGSAALALSTLASVAAGVVLGAITGTLERLPGLLVLVPAVLALRGNIGGALASRLSTSIHAGLFRPSWSLDSLVGQNVAAAAVLSLSLSFVFALLAKAAAIAFGVEGSISVVDFVVISVLGGALASVVVLAITLQVAAASARRGWDLDNVAAPVVTAAGDLATLPSLWLASHLVSIDLVTPAVGTLSMVVAVGAVVWAVRSDRPIVRPVVVQSLPILTVAGIASVVAGVTIENRLESFVTFPVLLVMIPPFLATSGAIGGIFSSRVATKLHLGTVDATRFRIVPIAEDLGLAFAFAFPVFLAVGGLADLVGAVAGLASPGVVEVVQVALLAGALATVSLVIVGYVGTVAAFRVGLDPDNYAIPIVTSTLDLLGAFSLILALVAVGVI